MGRSDVERLGGRNPDASRCADRGQWFARITAFAFVLEALLLSARADQGQPATAPPKEYQRIETKAIQSAARGDHAAAAKYMEEAIAAYDGSSADDLTRMKLNLATSYRRLGQGAKADQIVRELAAQLPGKSASPIEKPSTN